MVLAQWGVTGVALLGVSVTPQKILDIKRGGDWYSINLALDADAYLSAVRQAPVLSRALNIRILRIYNDVKHMENKELGNFLRVLGV